MKDILEDLDMVQQALGDNVILKKVTLIKNTMSDRYVAKKFFTELLSEYRADIL